MVCPGSTPASGGMAGMSPHTGVSQVTQALPVGSTIFLPVFFTSIVHHFGSRRAEFRSIHRSWPRLGEFPSSVD